MNDPLVLTRDRPLLWWIGAFLLTSISGAFFYLAYTERYSIEPWQSAATAMLGLLGIAAGIWIALQVPRSTVQISHDRSELQIVRTGITGRTVERYPVALLTRLTTQTRNDDEGYELSHPALLLANGDTVQLSMLWRHGSRETNRAIEAVRTALPHLAPRGVQMLAVVALALLLRSVPAEAQSTSGTQRLWYSAERKLDLDGDAILDRVSLTAVGTRSDSLKIFLRLLVGPTVAWNEEWTSEYNLVDPPEFTSTSERDSYIRDAFDRTLETVEREPFDSAAYFSMSEEPDSALYASPPSHQVSFSYGYETTVYLRWDPRARQFVLLYSCC